MAKFELSQKVKGKEQLSADQIKEFIKKQLSKSCKFEVTSESPNALVIKGKVIESLFTTVTDFQATFDIKVEGQNGRIIVNGESNANGVFWLFFLVGLCTGIFLLIGIGLYLMQQVKPKEACDSILKAVDTEFSTI
jgi:hypothetical protein